MAKLSQKLLKEMYADGIKDFNKGFVKGQKNAYVQVISDLHCLFGNEQNANYTNRLLRHFNKRLKELE